MLKYSGAAGWCRSWCRWRGRKAELRGRKDLKVPAGALQAGPSLHCAVHDRRAGGGLQNRRGDESSLAGSIPVRLRQALRGNGLRLPVLGFVPGAGGSEGVIGADPVPDPRRPARSPASR